MRIGVVDNRTSRLDTLVSAIQIVAPNDEITVVDYLRFDSTSTSKYGALIFSGATAQNCQPNLAMFREQERAVMQGNTPIFGICAGYLAVCKAFGAEVVEHPKLYGVYDITPLREDPLFLGIHQWQFFGARRRSVQNIPKELIPLASSKYGNEGVRHQHKLIYGVPCHPELGSRKTEGYLLIKNFLDQVRTQN